MSIYQYLSRGKEKFDGRYWKASEKRGTELVVIGEKHMDREAIAAMLRG